MNEDGTNTVSLEEMTGRMVRFKDLAPRPKLGAGVLPPEVIDFMTADSNYTYMAPPAEHKSRIQNYAALMGGDAGDGISVSLAVCSPGRGPALHTHLRTVEAFFCLSGRFAIEWGPEGENSVVLEPWDFVHVPTGVERTFHNVGDEEGALLVIIQGNKNDFDDVVRAPYVGEQLTERFGPEAAAKLDQLGAQLYSGTAG